MFYCVLILSLFGCFALLIDILHPFVVNFSFIFVILLIVLSLFSSFAFLFGHFASSCRRFASLVRLFVSLYGYIRSLFGCFTSLWQTFCISFCYSYFCLVLAFLVIL